MWRVRTCFTTGSFRLALKDRPRSPTMTTMHDNAVVCLIPVYHVFYSSCFLTSLGSRCLAIFVGGNYPPHRDLTTTHQKHPDTIFVNVPERSTRMRQDICAVCLHLLQKTSWHGMHFLPGVMPPQIIRKALKDLGPEKSRRVPRGADRSSSTGTDSLQGDWPVRRWRGSWPQRWLKKRIYYKWQKNWCLEAEFQKLFVVPPLKMWEWNGEISHYPADLFKYVFLSINGLPSVNTSYQFFCVPFFSLARLRDRVSDRLPSRKAASFPWHWMLWSSSLVEKLGSSSLVEKSD